jgi:hypothetical protein
MVSLLPSANQERENAKHFSPMLVSAFEYLDSGDVYQEEGGNFAFDLLLAVFALSELLAAISTSCVIDRVQCGLVSAWVGIFPSHPPD